MNPFHTLSFLSYYYHPLNLPAVAEGHPYLLRDAKQELRPVRIVINRIKAINLFFI